MAPSSRCGSGGRRGRPLRRPAGRRWCRQRTPRRSSCRSRRSWRPTSRTCWGPLPAARACRASDRRSVPTDRPRCPLPWGTERGVDRVKKAVVAVLGIALLLIGIALLVLPGPGFLLIAAALALLATQFDWAKVPL